IPTHHTKLVISQAHPTVLLRPQVPIPSQSVVTRANPPNKSTDIETASPIIQLIVGPPSTCLAMSYVTSPAVLPPVTNGSRTDEVTGGFWSCEVTCIFYKLIFTLRFYPYF